MKGHAHLKPQIKDINEQCGSSNSLTLVFNSTESLRFKTTPGLTLIQALFIFF